MQKLQITDSILIQMKIKNFALTAALVLAGTAFFQQTATAQTPVVYTDGDLFMGFRSSTATNDYLWDIGQFSQFTNLAAGTHLALGNISADLTTVFGVNWASNNNIQWGSAGTHDFDSSGNQIVNLYATKAEPTLGTLASPWLRQSTSNQGFTSSRIETLAFFGFFGNTSTANNPNAIIQPTLGTSWASFQPGGANTTGGTSFDTWNPTVEAPGNVPFGTGIPTTRLDLFEILPDNGGLNPPSTYLGTFSIDSLGNVSFDTLPIPEPSTYALLIAGGLLALFVARRQRKSNINA